MPSIKKIEQDPLLIESLTKDEIEKLLTKHKGQHFPDIRERLKQRASDIKAEEKVDSLVLNIEAIYHRVSNIYEQENVPTLAIRHARSIANDIHDLPSIHSGYESLNSLKQRKKDPAYTPCKDHYYPRLWSGLQIVEQIYLQKKKFKTSVLAELLYNFCHVHFVTEEENNNLRQHQTIDRFVSPDKSYKAANIQIQQVQPYVGHEIFKAAMKKIKQKEKNYK